MKKSHESSHEFPEEQVRSAIQLGIKQAEAEQKSQSKNKPIKKKHAVIYTMASIAAAFIILIGFFLSISCSCKQFIENTDCRFCFW